MKKTILVFLLGVMLASCDSHGRTSGPLSVVFSDEPEAFFEMGHFLCNFEPDLTGNGHDGVYRGSVQVGDGPLGSSSTVFDGLTGRLEIPDSPTLSITATGALTIEAWIRPDTLLFPDTDGTGYVNFLGKGRPGQHEYAMRMYSSDNTENRRNRVSAYAFNLPGGLGAGSYFQDPIVVGEWIHVAAVYDVYDIAPEHPTGTVTIYKNGVRRDKDPLKGYGIVPMDGTAPLGIGSRDNNSFFLGAISSVALYTRALTDEQILSHAQGQ